MFANLNILSHSWGRVQLSFGNPFSLKEFIEQQNDKNFKDVNDTMPSILPGLSKSKTDHTIKLQEKLMKESMTSIQLRSLGFKVLSDINKISITMPTALVGTVLLTLRGRGVGKEEVINNK